MMTLKIFTTEGTGIRGSQGETWRFAYCHQGLFYVLAFRANSVNEVDHYCNIHNQYQALYRAGMAEDLVNFDGDERCRDDYAEPLGPTFHHPEADAFG